MGSVILKPGRQKSVLNHHPWIFSGAISRVNGDPKAGETVAVISSEGEWLASGAFSPMSQIRVRVWSFDPKEEISPNFFRTRLLRSIQARQHLSKITNAYRMVYSESDGLPGLIADMYDRFVVCQFLSAGVEYWKKDIVSIINDLFPNSGIYERSDVDSRLKEELPPHTGVLCGNSPPQLIEIYENNVSFLIDVRNGHKTGFYLDQRDNRLMVAEFSQHAEVLNCFSYTGGFGIFALKGKASTVINIDSSETALTLAQDHIRLNQLDSEKFQCIQGDIFQLLRKYRDSRRQFDIIILDPPKFADSKNQLEKAARGYKDINLLAIKLIRSGGFLFTFSCSGIVSEALFQKILADAALDAGRHVQIIRRLSQAIDHPVAVSFPEAAYLKGFICSVW